MRLSPTDPLAPYYWDQDAPPDPRFANYCQRLAEAAVKRRKKTSGAGLAEALETEVRAMLDGDLPADPPAP